MEAEKLWDVMRSASNQKTLSELKALCRNQMNVPYPDLFKTVLQIVAKAVHAEVGTFWVLSKKDNLISAAAQYGGKDLSDIRIAVGEGVAGKVIETGESTIIHDCQADPRWSGKADASTGFITKTMICVPVKNPEGIDGCIQVINRTDGYLYDDTDRQFLESLSDTVCEVFKIAEETEKAEEPAEKAEKPKMLSDFLKKILG